MKAINILTDHLKNPMGLENRKPRISWNCDEGIRQSAYAYVIEVNGEEKYHSEKIASDKMEFDLPFELHDREAVKVKIRLWDESDVKGEESEAHFETGISKWKAKWINPELSDSKERQPASYLKKEFSVPHSGTARLYITSHGLYEAKINGERVGDFILAPGSGDYRQRMQYQVYDVSELIQKGGNLIEVVIGDGWYRGNNGIDGTNHVFGDDLALLAQLEVNGDVVLVTDEDWQASQSGPIRFSDLEIGEVYDATMEDVDDYHGVRLMSFDNSILCCSDEVYVKEMERFEGKRIEVPDGSIVYDFSQNLAGYTRFELEAKKGQKLVIWHGETLDKDGNFTQANIDPGARNRNGGIPQKIEYTCKDGLNVYQPRFSIFGFRYIKVETDVDLSNAKFESIAVYSDMAETATFECDNKDVNRLFLNSMWSMKSNFTDIPTDCPHRERSGWTGDAQVFVPTGLLLHDSYSVFRKWLAECRLAQDKKGVVANVAPPINKGNFGITNFMNGSTGWGDACIIVPYVMYEYTGDERILAENYEMMKKWLAYLINLAKKRPLKKLFSKDPYEDYIIEKGFHWGEWCQPDVDAANELRTNLSKGAPKSATAYYYYSAKLLGEIAGILGKKDDEKKYGELSAKVREAYNHVYTDEGIVHSDRQCDYLRPLRFDLIDHKEENAKLLNEMIVNNDYHLNTGFLSTPFLCPVLCEYGFTETAYRLLLQETTPSWLYAVKQGATTIWENWNGIDAGNNGSLNHYSYGAVSGWLISGVCGINVNKGKTTITPAVNKLLKHAKASYQSPCGLIGSEWAYEGDKVLYRVSIPANTSAEVILPDGSRHTVNYGVHEFETRGE